MTATQTLTRPTPLQIISSGELRCQFVERTFADEGIAVQTIESRIELTSVSAVILHKGLCACSNAPPKISASENVLPY